MSSFNHSHGVETSVETKRSKSRDKARFGYALQEGGSQRQKTVSMRQKETKRWQNVDRTSSESRSNACIDYAESQERKKNSILNIKPFDGGD